MVYNVTTVSIFLLVGPKCKYLYLVQFKLIVRYTFDLSNWKQIRWERNNMYCSISLWQNKAIVHLTCRLTLWGEGSSLSTLWMTWGHVKRSFKPSLALECHFEPVWTGFTFPNRQTITCTKYERKSNIKSL